ncbi:MAG TPA: ABC transporter substrate-binding protein [Actinomycetota bacterium]|nr:ABC transporter substrate-binding protein [Actinomycetota bacterium]
MKTSFETRAIRRWMTLAFLGAFILSSCTEDTVPRRATLPRGGTLEANLVRTHPNVPVAVPLDPQTGYDYDGWAILRCCLVRTLLSYTGRPTAEGGAELHPDLAAALPDVSADNLTWTFRLKRGLRYGPPFTDTEIVAPDIVRALERMARVGAYTNYYTVIEGFTDVMSGESQSISGLETPDDHTLVVHLTEPTGELGHRLSLPGSGPIPPSPRGPLGVADGHQDYGPFLVSSGPYALEGSEELNFARSADAQAPSSGYRPGESLTLVRNPAWRAATDRLRPAYADRIDIRISGDSKLAAREVHQGDADVILHSGPSPQVPPDVIEAYRRDPGLSDRISFAPTDEIIFSSLNLAVPPFDDLHVRKAVNHAVNKSRYIQIQGGPTTGKPATHIILDSMENNLLLDYAPYGSPSGTGDLDRARQEIAQSRYDQDGDGVCDAAACKNVRTLNFDEFPGVDTVRMAESIRSDLEELGINLDIRIVPYEEYFGQLNDPRSHVAMGIVAGWIKDFPSAASHVAPLFSREGLDGCCNHSLVGATREELQEWGYKVTSVPSVEEKISECRPLHGDDQVRCWTELDQQLMEQVVPWIPLYFSNRVYIVSRRVVASSFDQFTSLPALDRIALSRGTGSP